MTCSSCKSKNKDNARYCTKCGTLLLPGQAVKDLYASTVIDDKKPQAATLRPVATNDLIGQTIAGKYRIDTILGTGGMGQVYRATRISIGDKVAVKILQPELADNQEIIKRFHIEAQAAARLKHPNVVAIYDFGSTDTGLMYLVMEMIEGRSLREILSGHGRFAPADAYKMIAQICAALDEAHHQNIVHRDLKPENIIITSTTHGNLVKVVDFGIAKLLNPDNNAEKLTRTGATMGTPFYMSPEQCAGRALDHRADIYSLGILLYEMFASTVPFKAPTVGALIMQHITATPPPLSIFQIPPEIEAVVLQALAKQPQERQQSARELLGQLKAAIKRPAAQSNMLANQSVNQADARFSNRKPSGEQPPIFHGNPPVQASPLIDKPAIKSRRIGLWLLALLMFAVAIAGLWWLYQEYNKTLGYPGLSGGASSGVTIPNNSLTVPYVEPELRKVSIDEMLIAAESDFRKQQFHETITICNNILSLNAEQSKANLLLGQSYYCTGNSEGIRFLVKAINANEKVTLPIKHHHFEGLLHIDDGFCSGSLIFQKVAVSFRSDGPGDHNFSIPGNAITDLQNEADKAGRIHIKAPVTRNGQEITDNYNFHPPAAGLNQGKLRTVAFCNSPACLSQAETIYQLFQHIKQLH
jgi:serine/threonine protein kinase